MNRRLGFLDQSYNALGPDLQPEQLVSGPLAPYRNIRGKRVLSRLDLQLLTAHHLSQRVRGRYNRAGAFESPGIQRDRLRLFQPLFPRSPATVQIGRVIAPILQLLRDLRAQRALLAKHIDRLILWQLLQLLADAGKGDVDSALHGPQQNLVRLTQIQQCQAVPLQLQKLLNGDMFDFIHGILLLNI